MCIAMIIPKQAHILINEIRQADTYTLTKWERGFMRNVQSKISVDKLLSTAEGTKLHEIHAKAMKGTVCVSFAVKKVPVSLNKMLRMHWLARKREQEAWDLHIFAQWLSNRKMIFTEPVKILYVISFETNRQRDFEALNDLDRGIQTLLVVQ